LPDQAWGTIDGLDLGDGGLPGVDADLAASGSLQLPIASVIFLALAIPAIIKLQTSGHPKGQRIMVPG
jgi:hypothetical protein